MPPTERYRSWVVLGTSLLLGTTLGQAIVHQWIPVQQWFTGSMYLTTFLLLAWTSLSQQRLKVLLALTVIDCACLSLYGMLLWGLDIDARAFCAGLLMLIGVAQSLGCLYTHECRALARKIVKHPSYAAGL